MAGRTTVYNQICTEEKLNKANPDNIKLGRDFLHYLASIDRSETTINAYEQDLNVFWCWLLDYCDNKFFIELSKRDVVSFQHHGITEWQWSPARLRRVKAVLSSLSNYIETILDDEFPNYKPIVRKIESPPSVAVREKTILSKTQLDGLLDELVKTRQYDKACMLALAMCSGRRKSELPRMKVSYFEDENLLYGGSLYKTPEKVVTKGRGSKGKPLTIYTLAKPFDQYLWLWMKYRRDNDITSEWLIPAKENGHYVDKQIKTSTLDSWAKTFSRILGVPFYWHSLRHYFTTECSRSGLPDDVIKGLVGWESNDMVAIYKDIDVDEQLEKYFDENGIKKLERKRLIDL